MQVQDFKKKLKNFIEFISKEPVKILKKEFIDDVKNEIMKKTEIKIINCYGKIINKPQIIKKRQKIY